MPALAPVLPAPCVLMPWPNALLMPPCLHALSAHAEEPPHVSPASIHGPVLLSAENFKCVWLGEL